MNFNDMPVVYKKSSTELSFGSKLRGVIVTFKGYLMDIFRLEGRALIERK